MPDNVVRLKVAPFAGLQVDREAGILRGVSVITIGPAIGHGFDVDDVMIRQVCDGINAAPKGIRSRLAHPEAGGLFTDGKDPVFTMVGRVKNAHVDGDRCRADAHFGTYADSSPSGKLKTYLMDVAEEDPEMVGLSIVFSRAPYQERQGLPPAGRIAELLAVDFVGDPGANPSGLLGRGANGETAMPQGTFVATTAAEREIVGQALRLAGGNNEFTGTHVRRMLALHAAGRPVVPSRREALRQRLVKALARGAGVAFADDPQLALAGLPLESMDLGEAAQKFFDAWAEYAGGGRFPETPAAVTRWALVPGRHQDCFGPEALMYGAGDFPAILADGIDVVFRDVFAAATPTWQTWGRQVEVKRWAEIKSSWLDPFGALRERKAGEGYQQVEAAVEGRGTYRLRSYGIRWDIGRQIYLGYAEKVFNPLARFALAAAVTEDDVVYDLLLSNPPADDGKVVFCGDHANLLTLALDATNLATARAALAAQTTPAGVRLNLKARYLLVPVALAGAAGTLLHAMGNADLPDDEKLIVVVEPRLDAEPTGWYIAADPRRQPVLEVAFLEGERQPYTDQQIGFDAEDWQFKVRHEFGAGLVDYRGAVKSIP